MKLNHLFQMSGIFRALLAAVFALSGAGALRADDFFTPGGIVVQSQTINLGNAGASPSGQYRNWAIFALSGGVTITDPNLAGTTDVFGNVGVAGAGNLTMYDSTIAGSAYRDSGSFNNTSGTITGSNTSGFSAYLNQGVTDAINASNTMAGLSRSTAGLTLSGALAGSNIVNNDTTALQLNNTAGGISGAANTSYVLNLTSLMMSGAGAILTLDGAATTNYIININQYMTLSSQAKIVLTGGLTEANIVYNVKSNNPEYDVTLSGGSHVEGIILATTRNVKLTGQSSVHGEIIAKGVSLSGNSHVSP